MKPKGAYAALLLVLLCPSGDARALERPWIGDVFFYWYTWDYDRELGGWIGGIHNTPLDGYYDSRTFRDNRRSLWMASEWGLTHHFMDYWTPDWKGEGGEMREATVMRAAESLRKDGYDIWMSYYQDGENFEMRDFSRNVSEKRDVHQWLRDFARSPVWPKIEGQPLQLVYARNGSPKTTIDHAGFRGFLKDRYGDVAALNRAWQTGFKGFDDIEMTFGARGHQRAASIAFQYSIWEREWQKLNGVVKKEFGVPGMRASFDVGYEPYMGFGFADFARVFGGPHSYAGIFAQPHDQDAQRYIQASLARKYNTVFLDHFKNYYFDWDIRVPGMAFHAEPYHFDRFWVGALARRSEALLHLSWNEWWEGSNLEPCREFGKTYCEKNLFYATLMKLAFDSIHNAERAAPVGLLLNDWRFASGAEFHEELYDTIQSLRRLCVPFDLVPDGMATPEQLERFKLVIVPAYGCGLGYNGRGEPIAGVLQKWLQSGKRRLVISHHPSLMPMFGLREALPAAKADAARGPDMNVFVDVGAEGDDPFLRSGYSHRESWGGAVKPGEPRSTFRWTPASGSETSLLLPASPGRDHVLRIVGRTLWPNKLTALVNGRDVGKADVPAGEVRLEIPVPAASVGSSPVVSVGLRHAQTRVPMKEAPAQYPGEARVCNLALEWLQWSTANVAADTRKQQYTMPKDSVRLTGDIFSSGRGFATSVPVQPREYLDAGGAKVVSVVEGREVPRDILLAVGPSAVLYVNGRLSEVRADEYWLPLVTRWAGAEFPRYAAGPHCMVNRLSAGDTDFIVAANEDIAEPRELRFDIRTRDLPLGEAAVLTRDGKLYQPLAVESRGGSHLARDMLHYYGVYQFAFSPVRIETPPLALQPGESKAFPVRVVNLTEKPVRGRIEAAAAIPTVTGRPAEVQLQPGEKKTVELSISVAPTADWGRKTIYVNLALNDRRAVVFRELIVERPTEIELADVVIDPASPRLEVRVRKSPYGRTAPLVGARLSLAGRTVALPAIAEGESRQVSLAPLEAAAPAKPELRAEKLRIDLPGPRSGQTIEREVYVAVKPKDFAAPADAITALVVFNPRATPLEKEPVAGQLPEGSGPYCVRLENATSVPSQSAGNRSIRWLADVPSRSGRTYYLCRGEAKAESDLRYSAEGLGTGKGTLKIENSRLSVVLSEAAGGTMTSLRSAKTGRDYGRKSFGAAYGTFSRYDPKKPTTSTVEYIDEKKVQQEDTPGRIELLSHGPVAVVTRVKWSDRKVKVEQTYEFRAHQPYFLLRQEVRPIDLAGQQELVAINAQFQPNRLTKSFPNFVGVPSQSPQPHFGWRKGDWVPDYATLMAPDHFDESVSLIVMEKTGLRSIRQGFWPEKRPSPGRCAVAQVELLADLSTGCNAELYVLLHEGHQIVARRFLDDRLLVPKVEVVEKLK